MKKLKSRMKYIQYHPDYINIQNWENYKTNNIIVKDTKNIKINGSNLNNTIPIFQSIIENNIYSNNIIYEDDIIIILIPAESENINSPLNLTSFCHFLIIPKIRIFNAVTLKPHHLKLLKYMKKIGNNIMKSVLVSNNNIHSNYDKLTYKDINNNNPFKLVKNFKIGLGLHYDSALKIHKSIQFSVHLTPENSVGYLHIHCYLKDLMFEKNTPRNYPLDKIIKFLEKK